MIANNSCLSMPIERKKHIFHALFEKGLIYFLNISICIEEAGRSQGCRLAFYKTVLYLKWFRHLVIFWSFWTMKKIVYFKVCFGKIWAKIAIFLDILTLMNLSYFNKKKTWPFFCLSYFFVNLASLKLKLSKFGLFTLLDLATQVRELKSKQVIENI